MSGLSIQGLWLGKSEGRSSIYTDSVYAWGIKYQFIHFLMWSKLHIQCPFTVDVKIWVLLSPHMKYWMAGHSRLSRNVLLPRHEVWGPLPQTQYATPARSLLWQKWYRYPSEILSTFNTEMFMPPNEIKVNAYQSMAFFDPFPETISDFGKYLRYLVTILQ